MDCDNRREYFDNNIIYPIKVISYHGNLISNEMADVEKSKFMDSKINKMQYKYFERIKNCKKKKQIDKFCKSSNKLSTLVQIRNEYECYDLVDSKYESVTLSDNKVKNITIILPDTESECSKSECSCARKKNIC